VQRKKDSEYLTGIDLSNRGALGMCDDRADKYRSMMNEKKGGLKMVKLKRNKRFYMFVLSLCIIFIGTGFLVPGVLFAQSEFIIYPGQGQSEEQQEKDEFECYSWARKQSGFDPMAPPTATVPPPQQEAKKGGLGRGAVGGALLGLGIGAIAGDAGKGSAIGAVGGGAIGGLRRREQKQQEELAQQQWAQDQAAQYTHRRNNYNRAYSACLQGRGYTVK
jgi:hypothetical protein